MSEKLTTRIEPASAAQGQRAAAPDVPSSTEGAKAAQSAGAAQGATNAGAEGRAADEPACEPSASELGVFARTSRWFNQTFPNSKNAVIGGVAGLLLALLLFSIGLFKTLVIAILVLVGVAVGQYLDGDPKLVKAVQNLMKKR